MKFKHFWQLEKRDCAPTCLRMVCKHYGKELSITQIRDLCETSRLGTSILDLKVASERLGFESYIGQGEISNLSSATLPVILYWHPAHFVVLYKIRESRNKKHYYIADPSYGKLEILENTILDRWIKDGKGVLLLLSPTTAFFDLHVEKEKRENIFSELWGMYKSYINKHKKKISIAFILIILGMIFSWLIPFFLGKIVDLGIIGKNLNIVVWILLLQFVMTFGNFLARIFSSVILMKVNFEVGVQIMKSYLNKIIKLPIAIFDRKQSADFIVKLGDISRIQNFMSQGAISLFLLVINIIVFSSLLLYFNVKVFLVVFVFISLGLLWTTFFIRKRKIIDYELTRLETENNLAIHEVINEMVEIKANNAQNTKVDQWGNLYDKKNKTILSSLYLNYWQGIGANFFSVISSLGTTAICAYLVINNSMTLGTMMSIGFIVSQLTVPIEQLVYLMRGFQEVAISNERVQEIYRYKEENEERETLFHSLSKGIHINNVSFKYLGTGSPWVLKDINFFIPKNRMTAIVGISGSGKTTLLKILLGFYPPNAGSIYLDDINLNNFNLELYRNEIGVVMQNGYIFSSSIMDNIAVSDTAPDINRVKEVSKIACLDDFINSLPQKYKTRIGKNGIELSGGQKQRVLIARALYKNPQIIILDEATSALDANTEKTIVENLNNAMKNKTVIVIAHRFSTIKAANQIIVLDEGRIVESGDHRLLTDSKGKYFELVKNQLDLN